VGGGQNEQAEFKDGLRYTQFIYIIYIKHQYCIYIYVYVKITRQRKIFYQNLKINTVVKKFKISEINGYKIYSANGQSQTATLNYGISCMWETKTRTNPQKTSRLLMRLELVMRPKILQAIW